MGSRPACIMRLSPPHIQKEEFYEAVKERLDKYLDVFVVQDDYYVIPEHESLNITLEHIQNAGYKVCFIIDSDEYLDDADVKVINDYIIKSGKDAVMVSIRDYTGYGKAIKKRSHTPIVAVRTNKRFFSTRCMKGDLETMDTIILHHFGLMCKKTKAKKKEHWDPGEIPVLKQMLSMDIENVPMQVDVAEIMQKALKHGKGDICKK